MSHQLNILIAGLGYVGRELGTQLAASGHRVWGISRRGSQLPGITAVPVDLLKNPDFSSLPAMDATFFLLAPGPSEDLNRWHQTYVVGLQSLLSARAGLSSAGKLIFISSTSVYGQTNGAWIDESTEYNPISYAGRALVQAETWLKTLNRPHVIVRFGGIYGEGRTSLLNRVFQKQVRLTPEPFFTNRVHLTDCVGILKHVSSLDSDQTSFIGVDSEPALWNDVISWIGQQLLNTSDFATMNASEFAKKLSRGHKRCSNARLIQSGYCFSFPNYRMGYKKIIEKMKSSNIP